MLKLFHIFLLSLVFLGAPCCAITIKANDIHTIESQVAHVDPEVLVIFDVDDVLMHSHDQILKAQNKPYLEEIEKKLEKRLGEKKADTLYSLIFSSTQKCPCG